MSAKYYILVSALLYALVPVSISLVGGGSGVLFGFDINLVLFLFGAVFLALNPKKLRALLASPRRNPIVVLGTINALALAGSLYCAYLSLAAEQIASTVILEIWPIFVALLLPLLSGGQVRRPDPFKLVVILISLVGFLTLASATPPQDWARYAFSPGAPFALASAALMALSVCVKFHLVRLLTGENHSATDIQLVLQVFYLVPSAIFLPLALASGQFASAGPAGVLFAAGAAILVFLSSALYNAFLDRTADATDQIVWFFSPVLASVLFIVLGMDQLSSATIIGMTMIVTCNVVLNFPPEEGVAYRFSVIFLVAAGYYCTFVPGLDHEHYYDVVGLASVFYVVLATLNLETGAQRAERERDKLDHAWRGFSEVLAPLPEAEAASLDELFWSVEQSRTKSEARGHFESLRRALAGDINRRDRFLTDYEEYLDSRFFGSGFAEFMAIGAMTLLIVVAAMAFRGNDFIANLLAVSISFSVVYIFLANLDALRARRIGFYLPGTRRAGRARPRPRRFQEDSATDARYWSAALVLLVFLALIVNFAHFV